VEVNPWLERNGRGTFPNAVRAVERAARWLKEEQEPTVDGGMRQVRSFLKPMRWDVRCGDARDLAHIPSASIDLVLTDPPYFDYIAYSELGHFFVPWLARLGLVDESHLDGLASGKWRALS
jgi:adenine-specific DNA methylase